MMQMGSMGLGVELENPMNLGDGLRIFRRTVIARRDEFALGAIEVAAPIGNNPIAAVGRVATLLGRCFTCNAAGSAVSDSRKVRPTVSSFDGVLTNIEPMRPIQLLARFAPRCGVDMKTTRPISRR